MYIKNKSLKVNFSSHQQTQQEAGTSAFWWQKKKKNNSLTCPVLLGEGTQRTQRTAACRVPACPAGQQLVPAFQADSPVTPPNPALSSVKSQSNIIPDGRYARGCNPRTAVSATSERGRRPQQHAHLATPHSQAPSWGPHFPPGWCFQSKVGR